MSKIQSKLATVVPLMQKALSESTGLGERERKLVVYAVLATHALPYLDTFPVLVLLGKMGTGKSQTLMIVDNFSFRSCRMSLRGMTGPAIRDKFASCHEGTAIVEEADAAWKDGDSNFERLISDRYQRATAEASLKEAAGERRWRTDTRKYFGATVLHRRVPFVDPALDGRSVIVRFRPDHARQYREFDKNDPGNAEGRKLIGEVTFELPNVEQPERVAARVFNSYRPLLGMAKLCGDSDFEKQTLTRLLLQNTLELKGAQASEPDGLVLQAIVEAVFQSGVPQFENIRFGGLSDLIWKNHRLTITPRQIGPIARELGFETKASHGVTVVVPTAASLLRACDECDYSDDGIEELRNQVLCSLEKQDSP